jgi:glycosyltransferase involved in cell wall biosynthesis
MKKRILIISQHFYPEIGSAGNRMKNIYQLLTSKGYDVSIITSEPSYPNRKLYEDNEFWDDQSIDLETPKIRRIQVANRKYSRSIFNRLLFFLEVAFKLFFIVIKDKQKYDIVFATSPPIFIGIVGLLAKYKFRSRFILDIRDLWPESLKGVEVFNNRFIIKLFSLIETMLYEKADHIVVNSKGFSKHISKKASFPKEKIIFIPNSAREHELNQEVTLGKEFKVIYTGNMGLAQDIDFLKQLANRLNELKIELSIVSYGMKSYEFKSYIKKEKLHNVKVLKPLTRKKCLELIRTHHIGIVSLNNKEVFDTVLPGKIVDYMTCRIPIVASVSGYAKRIIEENKVGYVSERRDMEEIVGYIKHLRNHPEKMKQMSMNSEQCIRENFLWEENIELLEFLIDDRIAEIVKEKQFQTEFHSENKLKVENI